MVLLLLVLFNISLRLLLDVINNNMIL